MEFQILILSSIQSPRLACTFYEQNKLEHLLVENELVSPPTQRIVSSLKVGFVSSFRRRRMKSIQSHRVVVQPPNNKERERNTDDRRHQNSVGKNSKQAAIPPLSKAHLENLQPSNDDLSFPKIERLDSARSRIDSARSNRSEVSRSTDEAELVKNKFKELEKENFKLRHHVKQVSDSITL